MIIHAMSLDKFIQPFIDFTNENFSQEKHYFYVLNRNTSQYKLDTEVKNLSEINQINKILLQFIIDFYKADKVIIHGLFSRYIVFFLFLQPWLLKKCYWVMWGGDFYFPEKQSWIKKQVIRKIGHFITYIKGDYELVQQWYGVKGQYHECFMYPSNLYKEYDVLEIEDNSTNILVGNSADPTNNHFEIFDKLLKYKDDNIKIYVPLSYGNEQYAQEVITKGKKLFGDKFIALTEFMPFDKYLELLGTINIAVFAHKRQQAMGNTITLLGLGKKVYMRSDITPWQLFEDIDVKVFDVENIEMDLIDEGIKFNNQKRVKEYFSKENYLKQLKNLFEE